MAIWTAIRIPRTVEEVQRETGLSAKWTRNLLRFLVDSGLASYESQRPIVVVRNEDHELKRLLKALTSEKEKKESLYTLGSTPFDEMHMTPEDIEKTMYEKLECGVTVKGTVGKAMMMADLLSQYDP